ncbi:MarR family transcriptional regulator [Pseudogemmobacter sp. W21_MBD1_M6]|uniref:MarR family winged helix-turn-helix transcriptional regulator n=1 Tax=Pseudogemmobacter sp. W21_MBD1_M6 TaxID=3240271 RepID=UPI003F9C9261
MKNDGIEKFGLLLHDAARLMRKGFGLRGKELWLLSAQWRFPVRLLREGRSSQARLAEMMKIEPTSVSRLVDRMTKAGWITREPDENDRRLRIVVPLRKPLRPLPKTALVADEVCAEAMAGLSDTERRALVLTVVVTSLSNNEDLGGFGQLGGWLTESMNWRWVFFINLPIGIIALFGCITFLPEAAKRLRIFDVFGFAMLTIAIGSLQLMLDRGPGLGLMFVPLSTVACATLDKGLRADATILFSRTRNL